MFRVPVERNRPHYWQFSNNQLERQDGDNEDNRFDTEQHVGQLLAGKREQVGLLAGTREHLQQVGQLLAGTREHGQQVGQLLAGTREHGQQFGQVRRQDMGQDGQQLRGLQILSCRI